jgi:type III restriction enzyme
MELKTYQQNTLNVLRRFFEGCRVMGAAAAYEKITGEPDIKERLGKLRGDYVRWDAIPNTPRVCLKIPTGGGKTIVAAQAIKVVADTWREKENPVVLWFCPSDTIRKQTGEALKNPRHPYRVALDEQFNSVRVFDLDEKFNVRPADIANNTCVIVSSVQAFRQSSVDKYKVYKHHEDLEPHFARIKNAVAFPDEKFSFANLLFFHQPVVVVDEAHNFVSDLSQELLGRISPSAIVELTATPRFNNNTLYNVRASELKEEEMIKLPIELREHLGWEHAVDEAVAKRVALVKEAANETDYVRPIVLFQAQDKNGEVNTGVLKQYLMETAGIPETQIAVATGEQKELDGVDVFRRDCPVTHIITVEALKEGWDCSFAYVLCSLANVQSNTAVEQLLGRVMRMPYARLRKTPALNKAYAYVLSRHFGEAADALVKRLVAKGFDETEAAASVEFKQPELYGRREPDKVDLEDPILAHWVPASIKTENDGKTLVFTPETTDADIALVAVQIPGKARELQYKFSNYKLMRETPSPAKQGKPFTAPRLMVEIQGEFVLADPETIFEEYAWDLLDFSDAKQAADGFEIEPQGDGFVINLEGNRLTHHHNREQLVMPQIEMESWTTQNLIWWLHKKTQQRDISHAQMAEWLRRIVERLTEVRGLALSSVMIARYALMGFLLKKIDTAREKARLKAHQQTLFDREDCTRLDFDNGFEFFEGMYDGELFYQGGYKFQKHFLGPWKVPVFDGKQDGEEFDCAKAIDRLSQVDYWLRNVPHKNSFWLPTHKDKFYPDFVAKLKDGRIFVVEYKGGLIATSDDTKEKANIGALWEKYSQGRALFQIAEKSKDDLNPFEQLKQKVNNE